MKDGRLNTTSLVCLVETALGGKDFPSFPPAAVGHPLFLPLSPATRYPYFFCFLPRPLLNRIPAVLAPHSGRFAPQTRPLAHAICRIRTKYGWLNGISRESGFRAFLDTQKMAGKAVALPRPFFYRRYASVSSSVAFCRISLVIRAMGDRSSSRMAPRSSPSQNQ